MRNVSILLKQNREGGKTYIFTSNSIDHIIRRCPKELGDDGELVDVVLAGEEWLALEHLSKDAASTPDIHLDIVFLPGEHDFGSSVVSSRNVARHLGVLDPCQAEVADFQIAILVDQDVTRFQVTMDDSRGVNVFEASLNWH